MKKKLSNALALSVPVVTILSGSAFAADPSFTMPAIDVAPAISVVANAFSTYAPAIVVAGLSFMGVKAGIKMVPKLFHMFFK